MSLFVFERTSVGIVSIFLQIHNLFSAEQKISFYTCSRMKNFIQSQIFDCLF